MSMSSWLRATARADTGIWHADSSRQYVAQVLKVMITGEKFAIKREVQCTLHKGRPLPSARMIYVAVPKPTAQCNKSRDCVDFRNKLRPRRRLHPALQRLVNYYYINHRFTAIIQHN